MWDDVTIKYLDLSWNFINAKDMTYIVEMLKVNKSLRKLYIQHNNLEELGAKEMARALKIHTTIKYLDISANRIGSQGFMYFKELFASNSNLRNLHVRKNQIGDSDIDDFPLCLMENTHLKYLDLQNNNLSNKFGENLLHVIKNNITMEDLELIGNHYINQHIKEQLSAEVRMNLLIKEFIIAKQMIISPKPSSRKDVKFKEINRQTSEIFQKDIIRNKKGRESFMKEIDFDLNVT